MSNKKEEMQATVFWVDDEPSNNTEVIQKYLQPKKIDVIQVVSTSAMLSEIEKGCLKGKKVLFISDMSRREGDKMNRTAGIDLFEHLYHKLGLKVNSIAYVNHVEGTRVNIKQKGLEQSPIEIVNK